MVLQIYGHSIDENYSKLLIEGKDLLLGQVVLLDRGQKKLVITDQAAAMLKIERLIEGRKPNYFVAASVAAATNDKAAYILNKAFDDEHYKKIVEAFLNKFSAATRKDLEILITPKLSDMLTETQKKDKVKNLLQSMKRDGRISLIQRSWKKN